MAGGLDLIRDPEDIMVFNIAFMLATLAAIVGIAVYIYRLQRRLERERTVLLLQQEALRDQSEQMQETLRRCREYREEIAQMMAESGLFGAEKETPAPVEPAEITEAEAEDIYPARVYCENGVIQTVLQHKEMECRRNHIPLRMELDGIDEVNAVDMDLVGILHNLLDNAIEASLRLPDPQDRSILLSSHSGNKYWNLLVENRCLPADEAAMRRGTWKEDTERHGIGHMILRDLVRINRGQIRTKQKEDRYQVKIRLPLKRKAV